MTIPANAFAMKLTVGADDIDAQGHASNVTILKWISRAAWKHSTALGYDLEAYRKLGAWFVVRRHEIDYHGFARLDEQLIVYTWPSDLRKVVAERKHVIQRADGSLVAEGVNIWAYVDAKTGRPLRIPPQVRDTFDPARFV